VSLTSSPCSLCEPLRLGFLLSGPAAGLAWFHLSCIFSLVATTSIGLRSWQAEWLPGWQHIDLSEARGLVLFCVVREDIGITQRLSAQWALGAYRPTWLMLSGNSVMRSQSGFRKLSSFHPEPWFSLWIIVARFVLTSVAVGLWCK
jgi:hypothetical protein